MLKEIYLRSYKVKGLLDILESIAVKKICNVQLEI
jgi:hypothetical protein